MNPNQTRHVASVLVVLATAALVAGCAPRAMRGGPGTANPDIDRAAMSVTLDRDDITFLVADYLERLQGSAFWQRTVRAGMPPVVAIWPIQNATSQHLDEQILTLLSSIETALVNTGDVRVVERSRYNEITRELGLQQGAAYDPTTARQLGRLLGAQYWFTGKITSVDERLSGTRRVQYSLFLQVVEIESGLIHFQNEVTRTKALRR